MSRYLMIVVGSLLVLSAWPVLTMPVNATHPAASFRPQGVNNCGRCGGNGSDPHYSRDPYWYFSSQYVLGWAPGQARGSSEVIRTEPGRVIYSEMSYNPMTDAWKVFGRDETTGESSTYTIKHPIEDPARSWKEV